MQMSNKLKITLVKSLIGRSEKHRVVVRTLGLGKLNSSVILPNNAAVKGMVNKVCYLLNTEECK
jgi:large subunit ribosomal protein L30